MEFQRRNSKVYLAKNVEFYYKYCPFLMWRSKYKTHTWSLFPSTCVNVVSNIVVL
jgi:hypothetical protein